MPARAIVLGYALRDGTGSTATCRFNLRDGTTVAEGHAAGDDLRGKLAGIVGCPFVRQSVVYPWSYQPVAQALPGSDIRSRAALIFETSAVGQLVAVSIPAILPALVRQDGPNAGLELDLTSQAIIDFVDYLIQGPWCNPFGYDVVNLATTIVETVD